MTSRISVAVVALAVTAGHCNGQVTTETKPAEQATSEISEREISEREYVSFPFAGIKIVRPNGFDDAENFHGFQQVRSSASVMISTLPGSYTEMSQAFTAEKMITRGMKLESSKEIQVGGQPAILLSVKQKAYGTAFQKWILAFGDEKETRMVTATFPEAQQDQLAEQLKAVVLSARRIEKMEPDVPPDIGFAFDPPKNLKLAKQIASVGKLLLYCTDGVIPAKSPTDPLFLAAPSLSQVPIEDERQFAVRRVYQIANTRISTLKSNQEVTIDGLHGYEIEATGEYTKDKTPMSVYQVMLFDGQSYILLQGLVRAAEADQYLGEFRRSARSLKRSSK